MIFVMTSVWTVVIMAILSVEGARNYCGDNVCNNSKQHTLCKYQSEEPAPNCINYERLIKDDKDKISILNKINDRRNQVAAGDIRSLPSAENMMKLVWNEDLATSAQRWADQCVQHSNPDVRDTCRDLGDIAVGQNIATIYGEAPGLTPLALVDVWYTELLNINASIIARYRPSMEVSSLHYDYFTQLVWADSSEVGCGAVRFKQGSGAQKNETAYRLICNFAPSGNRIGQTVYADGTACSRCPERSACDDEHLALCHSSSRSIITTTLTELLDEDSIFSTQNQIDKLTSTIESFDLASFDNNTLSAIDYLFLINNYTTEKITIITEKQQSCKNTFEIDELLDLLKRKLSTDPMFKDMLTTMTNSLQTENGFGDSGVKAFINKIYNPKEAMMSTKAQKIENFNPTLLADLVEAVIFRSDKYAVGHSFEPTAAMEASEINPVKIQAELAEVKTNDDFTGHYFFPEDENEGNEEKLKTGESENSETSDSYYDVNTEIPVSDVVMELENLRKHATKDFIDDILESESVTESVTETTAKELLPDSISLFKSGHNNMKKFLEEIGDKNLKLNPSKDLHMQKNTKEGVTEVIEMSRRDYNHESFRDVRNIYKNGALFESRKDLGCFKEICKDNRYYMMGYKQLLKKLSRDVRQLNLQDNFHCSRCTCYIIKPILSKIMIISVAIIVLNKTEVMLML